MDVNPTKQRQQLCRDYASGMGSQVQKSLRIAFSWC